MTLTRLQQGFSILRWLLTLFVLVFLISVGSKILPHYLNYIAMEKIITSVEAERSTGMTIDDFYDYISEGMSINNIRDLTVRDILKVTMESNEFKAHLKYENREPLVGNLDLVVRFDKEFRVRMP